jgi:predicted DNA binding CopG/RHH family protein
MNTWESNKRAEEILKTAKSNKDKQINIRLTDEQFVEISKRATEFGFVSMSEYLRFAGLNIKIKIEEIAK